jgi:non-specific serine/threonine protein kinase
MNPAPSRVRARALWLAAWAPADADGARAGLPYALEAEQWAREHGDESMLAYAQLVLAGHALYTGEMDRAAELFAEADARFKDLGETNTVVLVASGMVALVAAFRDSADIAVAIAEDALARCEASGEQWATARVLWALACGQWQRGEFDAALKTVSWSLRISQSLNDGFGAALVLEVFAWASAAVGETVRAAEMLGMINQTWPRVGKPLGLPALTAAHDECVRTVRETLGSKQYDAAFRRGGANAATVDDVIAYALGSAPAAPVEIARDVDPNGMLTKRERQVADLVADGLSNRDIADRLVISQRTAETHVNRVLGKLGFTSRTQFAARMAQDTGPS